MKAILLVLCCSCGVGSVVVEDAAPKEKTCEYMVSGVCVNTNGYSVDVTVVQGTLDVVYSLVSELFGEFDVQSLLIQGVVSVDFVSGDEIGAFCTTSQYGCFIHSTNSIYVRLYDGDIERAYGQEMDEWFSECAWPGNILGHEFLHLFNVEVNEADWQENVSHATPGLFGTDGVEGQMNKDMNSWCYWK